MNDEDEEIIMCELLNIPAPIGKECPSRYNLDGELCHKYCGLNTWSEKK